MTPCNFIHTTTTRFSGNWLPGPLSYGESTKNYQEHVKNESFQSQKCCKGLALNLAGVIHRRIPHSDFAYCFTWVFLARSNLENDGLGGSQYSIVERTTTHELDWSTTKSKPWHWKGKDFTSLIIVQVRTMMAIIVSTSHHCYKKAIKLLM